jgi:signal transduction histidine kinase
LWEWAGVIGGITLVVLLSSLSLYWITRQTTKLEDALELAEARRVSEMSQLVIGLAHEIRNPLNAMRINLHTLERVHRGDASLAPAEVTAMLHESAREIERMEELMRNVLGYARTASTGAATVDLAEEVRAAVAFLKQKLERSEIRAAVSVPEASVPLHTDPARLRQILLNLVANACEALGPGGQITIGVQRLRDRLELTVADDGPGIAPQHRPRIFEPFFSTKPEGTGLGLALVRKFVEEAGGAVDYKPNPAGHGSLFRVWWPRRETEESGE